MGVQGLVIGAVFAAAIFAFGTLQFEPMLFIKVVVSGSLIGCITCMVIGASREEPHIEAHLKDVEKGGSIVIADLHRGQDLWTMGKVSEDHPEARIERGGILH